MTKTVQQEVQMQEQFEQGTPVESEDEEEEDKDKDEEDEGEDEGDNDDDNDENDEDGSPGTGPRPASIGDADPKKSDGSPPRDLENKAETFTHALVNEAIVSYMGDLDNKSDDDDEDKADEDHEDPAGSSRHQENDDDDTDQPDTGPSRGASTDPPPPSTSHSDPLVSKGTDDHPQELAKSIAMVSSSKGKEKATMGSTDYFIDANSWLHKEFHLAKQVQLKEYLQADDMNTDMKKLAALFTRKSDIFVNYFELMPDPPALLYAMRMEEIELPRFYPALYPPHTEPPDQLKYIQIAEQIGDWWEKAVGEFKAGMRAWKHHMQVLVKHTNALLQLHIAASKISEKQIENLASNEDTYREIGEILFEARIKANQPEPAGWLATTIHCHKLAKARVIKGKKTLYYPQTKEWLPMTPYEQQVLVKEPELLEQTVVYRIIKKQTTAQAMEAATSPQQPVQPRERKPPDKDKGKQKK
ncbi:hypothetical protein L7F22_047605 [Adiantum nelumboides]|nr:hypothetical protein [Adiantum nelumboides]